MNLLPRFLRRRAPKQRPEAAASGHDGLTPSMFAPLSAHRAPAPAQPIGLNPVSRKWIEGLPRRFRPLQLAERHPRLVNQIALIVDQRGGRQGFPPPILAEIMNLREFHGDRGDAEPDAIWADSTLATVDR